MITIVKPEASTLINVLYINVRVHILCETAVEVSAVEAPVSLSTVVHI